MRTTLLRLVFGSIVVSAAVACTATETKVNEDFAFDGTCINCHAGLSAGHVHLNYKLKCIECHGGDDTVAVKADAFKNDADYRDPELLKKVHVLPDPKLARFFYANGVDDDNDTKIDEGPVFDAGGQLVDGEIGEIFEPGVHGEGGGEFMDAELNRDLNYTRFINPGDLRVATVGCGNKNRSAFEGGGGGACHQETIDIVRRSIMVNQAAVTNGAYYGNESWRPEFINQRDMTTAASDPRFGAFGYALDYDGVDGCITAKATDSRTTPAFDRDCLQARATAEDSAVAAGAPGNAGLPAFEIAQGTIKPVPGLSPNTTSQLKGAGDSRIPWGGQPSTGDAHDALAPLLNGELVAGSGIPDPVDNILRTFRAYYPLNYPGSTNNFTFTFGTSILPEIARFKTNNPYGRGHSSGCAACHNPYSYEGNRNPTLVRNENPTDTNGDGVLSTEELFTSVVDPTTKHREFDPKNDRGMILGLDRLIGRPVKAQEVLEAGAVSQAKVVAQEKTYSANHQVTTKIDTDTCGLCHGFVTRINYAYQGMAEEEQRDQLARRKPIAFTTPAGTKVRIVDSWVREDNDANFDGVKDATPTVIIPEGVEIVKKARERDAKLLARGLIAGNGGCAQATFSEDCNNNGELDTSLVLTGVDAAGNTITETINEDLNGNGSLELIDRLPREKAIDGRQVRYIYGGRNGSQRQMDVHFERGMHCIDCHFIQDVHGDGHVYSTNWDAIEIECEDCHGASKKTNFKTSGPNGGNDMRLARNEDLLPFFEERGGKIIQRSRVTTGLEWVVPQTVDASAASAYAREAHLSQHLAEPKEGSTFAGDTVPGDGKGQGTSELIAAKVECASCHNGFVTNCLGCHIDIDVGNKVRNKLNPDGTIVKSAGENEVWLSNTHNPGHINFQLLALLRGSVVLDVAGKSEGGRLATVRSSMQAHASVTTSDANTFRENLTFTTFQAFDGNSGRSNVATSGVTMNQTMAHTVRPNEARGCEMCHTLVDNAGRSRNEHLLAQTYGLGTGSLPFTGDWIIASGANGIELYEYKQENELAGQVGASRRFPGLIVNGTDAGADRKLAQVEPIFDGGNGIGPGSVANDVVLIRNFNPAPPVGGTRAPTFTDIAVTGIDAGGAGKLMIADVSDRGNPAAASRPGSGNSQKVFVLNLPAPPTSLTHIASDVSDPYVYAAVGNAGVSVIRIDSVPALGVGPFLAQVVRTVPLTAGRTATDVTLAGDLLYVGTSDGAIEVFNINNPEQPVSAGVTTLALTRINDMVINGFVLYVAADNGLTALSLDDPAKPTIPAGASGLQLVAAPAIGVAVSEGHAFVAARNQGVIEVDMRVIATPKVIQNLTNVLGKNMNAVDVIVSQLPGQKYVIALDQSGAIVGLKLDNTKAHAERCYPNPGTQDCLLELEMYDPTRSGRDPSFDPNTGLFDSFDPSSPQVFVQNPKVIGGVGRRLARPTFFETIGTLTGRRYRDSFMPGAGVMSLGVMQTMRFVQVCELANPSTNPSGLNELGYSINGNCEPFGTSAKPKHVCKPGILGRGLKPIVCGPEIKTADPSKPSKPAAPVAPTKTTPVVLPATAAIVGLTAGR